jgi:FMN phosphatase YigB (HAD superfamily)
LGLTEYFDEIFCQESMNANNQVNKFQNAIEKLGISPDRITAFENEESEILLAIKAGIEIINPNMDGYNAKV